MEEAFSDLLVNLEVGSPDIFLLAYEVPAPFAVQVDELPREEVVHPGILVESESWTVLLQVPLQLHQVVPAVLASVEGDDIQVRNPLRVVCDVEVAELVGAGPGEGDAGEFIQYQVLKILRPVPGGSRREAHPSV